MKLFIANRGEIACRIARTAGQMGIPTCGVFTPQDARTMHVRVLGEVVLLPPGDLSENYLNQDRILEAAKAFRATALHPGYGFLAENPEFAERVKQSGLIWVGPSPEAMRNLGAKVQAKEVASRVGVPVTPWVRITGNPDSAAVETIVQQVGLPLLIKAVHGGGGRGQRVVRDPSRFEEHFRTARSEALRSFGSGDVFVERFLDQPRHIEVQILADQHGHVLALGERDCTLQRRNQKVIEESPAVVIDAETRRKMHESAIALAAAVNYSNAGTIEFLAQKDIHGSWEYFFMELNARLQVEHPVTELLYGIDLVEWQLRVARGERLPREWTGASQCGHAIELRLCAEDPSNQFFPTPGPITAWKIPVHPGIRIDSGYETGDVIPQEYDSLFAKLIASGESRDAAIHRLVSVLDQAVISGIITNKVYLRRLLGHPDFRSNSTFTRWMEDHPELLSASSESLDQDLKYWGKRFSSELFVQRRKRSGFPVPVSPNSGPQLLLNFHPDAEHGSHSPQGLVRISGHFDLPDSDRVHASGWINRFEWCVTFDREVDGVGQRRFRFVGEFEVEDMKAHHGPIVAQVPGVVLDIRARAEEIVAARTPILVVEAMKIEMPMSLPIAARITAIHVRPGDRIQPGQTLVTWEPDA